MKVHLINPSALAFGVGVITPRWLFVLAAATPEQYGDPIITDETLEPWDPETVSAGDVVGIGIHTGNAMDGYSIGEKARARGAYVVFGGIHATLYPDEAAKLGQAHAVVKGDGDLVWARVLEDCARNAPLPVYDGGKVEGAEDPEFLEAMRKANIKGALIGVEAVTPEGLKDVYKDFNMSGERLVDRLRAFRHHDIHVLGSFIFGLPSDRPATFDLTAQLAEKSGVTFAQFVMLTPFPGTVDFAAWEKQKDANPELIEGVPITRHWLIPKGKQPKVYVPHPVMSPDEIRERTQAVWDRFYSWKNIWERSSCVETLKSRIAFVLISKLYRQMYANTGIATDSARINRSATWARWIAKPCQRLFSAPPMPELEIPRQMGAF